jgi:hypothetical protein
MTSFRIGQKVVCVETWTNPPGRGWGDEIGPVKGEVYTVRGIQLYPPNGVSLCLLLEEIRNPVRVLRLREV